MKKNDEYQALTHEIELTEEKNLAHEELILEAMVGLDDKRAAHASLSDELSERIKLFEKEISQLKERQVNVAVQLKEAQAVSSKAEESVDKSYLDAYKRLFSQNKKFPLLVPLVDQRCQGCHIRVSHEVASAARHKEQLGFCDSCGRILYVE